MKKLLQTATVLTVFAAIGSAAAADLPPAPSYKAPPPATVVYGWTGFYAGVNGGYGWDQSSAAFSGSPNIAIEFTAGVLPSSLSPHPKGWLGGGQMGYNWQFAPAWLAGLETDLDGASIKGAASVSPTGSGFPDLFTTTISASTKWLGTTRARLGYLPTSSVLLYVTGGVAYGETQVGFNTSEFTFGGNCLAGLRCANASVSSVKAGWTVGGGIEGMIAPNWTVRAEYLYVDLGSQSVSATPIGVPPGLVTLTASHTFLENIVRVGVNYKFGG
jgi:outer membrane immunogenic protein